MPWQLAEQVQTAINHVIDNSVVVKYANHLINLAARDLGDLSLHFPGS